MGLKEYDVWKLPNDEQKYMISFRGSRDIYEKFQEAFPGLEIDPIRTSPQIPFDYRFFVHNATNADRSNFKKWLDKQQEESDYEYDPIMIDNPGYPVQAIDWHGDSKFSRIARKSKPYNQSPNKSHIAHANVLADIFAQCIQIDDLYRESNFIIAVPCKGKDWDLPQFITEIVCEKLNISNGSQFVEQVKHKQYSQKDLQDDLQKKRDNVKGIFEVKANHPFSGKIVTIIDDIYMSGITLDEVATILKAVNADVRGLVATKTFRD